MQKSKRISKQDAEKLIQERGCLYIWTHHETQEYFFTDSYIFPEDMQDYDNWVSCSYRLPNHAAPRKGLEDGKITTLDHYLLVFCDGNKELDY